jgi:hypothetical protein
VSDIDLITDRADNIARIIIDQLAADGCANLENIRNALLAPLIKAAQDDIGAVREVMCPHLAGAQRTDIQGHEPAMGPAGWFPAFYPSAKKSVAEYERFIKKARQITGTDAAGLEALAIPGGISAEEARQAVIHAKSVGHPVLVYGHLDVIATPEGKITTDYAVFYERARADTQARNTQARNDAVTAEEVRQKAKILAPILDPLRVSGY